MRIITAFLFDVRLIIHFLRWMYFLRKKARDGSPAASSSSCTANRLPHGAAAVPENPILRVAAQALRAEKLTRWLILFMGQT